MKRSIFGVLLLFMMAIVLLPLSAQHEAEAQNGPDDCPDDPDAYHTGVFPRAMALDSVQPSPRVWVANWYDDNISWIDAKCGWVYDDAPTVSRQMENSGATFQPVAMAWDGEKMWIANYLNNTVWGVDGVSGERRSAFDTSHGINGPVALLFDGTNLWILNQGIGNVLRYNTATSQLSEPFSVNGTFPTAMTWSGTHLWVANGTSNSVSVLDVETGDLAAIIDVNLFPISIVFDGIHVWVSHYDGSIIAIDAQTMIIDETIEIAAPEGNPPRPVQLLYAFDHVWITNVHNSTVMSINAVVGNRVQVIPTTEEPVVEGDVFPATMLAVSIVENGVVIKKEIWVANWLDYTIMVHDPEATILAGTVNLRPTFEPSPGQWLPTATSPPVTPTQPFVCNTVLPRQLEIGVNGMVSTEYSDIPLRLRDRPGTYGTAIFDTYYAGTRFVVIGGPVCIDNRAWWQVQLEEDGSEGWFIETFAEPGDPETYAIVPLQ